MFLVKLPSSYLKFCLWGEDPLPVWLTWMVDRCVLVTCSMSSSDGLLGLLEWVHDVKAGSLQSTSSKRCQSGSRMTFINQWDPITCTPCCMHRPTMFQHRQGSIGEVKVVGGH